MYCPTCGKKLVDGAAFCSNCGAPVDSFAQKNAPNTDSASRINPSLKAVVGKNSSYYLTEFQKIDAGQRSRFNWSAFLLGPAMCFYRRCSELFRKYFLFPIILLLIGFPCSSIGTGIISLPLIMIGTILSFVSATWLLIAYIRFGIKFNHIYYIACQQKLSRSAGATTMGVSVRALILFFVAWFAAVAVCGGITAVVVHSYWSSALSDFDSDDSALNSGLYGDSFTSSSTAPIVGQTSPDEDQVQNTSSSASDPQTLDDYSEQSGSVGRFDQFVGTWLDEEGSGFMIMIGYGDETKQHAYAYVSTAAGDFEVELFTDDGMFASGADTGYGSEPLYALDVSRDQYWLDSSIYFMEENISYNLKFVPADPESTPYENPYYIG